MISNQGSVYLHRRDASGGHNYVETAVANGAGVIVAHKDSKAAAAVLVVGVPWIWVKR